MCQITWKKKKKIRAGSAPTLTIWQCSVNIWQFLTGTRSSQMLLPAFLQKPALPSTVWAANQHEATSPASAAWIDWGGGGGGKIFKPILPNHLRLPVRFCDSQICSLVINKHFFSWWCHRDWAGGTCWIFFFILGIPAQLKDTHSCLLILFAKPQPQPILTTPERFWQLWHRTYGSCGKMCWQVPYGPHPAIT